MAMNLSVDPCDDFFEYACGQWNRDHMIPDDMFAYGTFVSVRENVRQQMRVLLESDVPPESRSIEMTRIAYQTCMNTSKIKSVKSSQLLSSLRQLANWPLLDNNNEWDVPEDDRRNITRLYNDRTISDLYTLFPKVEWLNFFYQIAPESIHSLIGNDTEIIIGEIDYMYNIAKLVSDNSNQLLANYIFWRIVHSWVKVLDVRYEDIRQAFLRVMTGQQTKSPRWKECAQGAISLLPLAGGALYVREHFDSTDKQEALKMIANLQEAFKELVDENDWMDEETKKVAVEKAESMRNNIGYPDFISNSTALDKYYEKV
ncbi:hypothetical protein LOAG_14244 [Loa loa]|uniref:Peptidase M13 N-terminal domain-containing protein n=1 Tax=Loa loa TaxID=7209 RepID=A0A1S0TI41_LOALO|nr:hypothetical protein LOAG_14244 [Loa loa]EFO14278.2 hypothetical protein LOAG_14244 [Loa loa]